MILKMNSSEVVNFYLSSINIPEDDTIVIKLKGMLSKKTIDRYGHDYDELWF
jgi:hypothetical protein